MSTLGKILAFLNVFAAIAFVCLAAADWSKRQAWAYAVYRHDLLIQGLPVDEKEMDVDGQPLVKSLSDKTLQQVFQSGGQPVDTQAKEVRRRHDQLKSEIEADANPKQKFLQVVLPVQRTRGERDALTRLVQDPKVKVDELMASDGPFEKAFSEALDGKDAQGKELENSQRRQAIAHLLMNLSDDPAELQRATTVVGLAAASQAVDRQAHAYADMDKAIRADRESARSRFETTHKEIVQKIEVLAERVADLQLALQSQKTLTAKHQALVAARKADVGNVTKELEDARKATQDALAKQTKMEEELAKTKSEYAQALDANQKLEREIRTRELGR